MSRVREQSRSSPSLFETLQCPRNSLCHPEINLDFLEYLGNMVPLLSSNNFHDFVEDLASIDTDTIDISHLLAIDYIEVTGPFSIPPWLEIITVWISHSKKFLENFSFTLGSSSSRYQS